MTVTKIIKRTVNVYALGAKQLSIKSDNFFKKNSRTKRLGETAAETLPWKIYIQNKKNVYLTPLPPFPSQKKKKTIWIKKKNSSFFVTNSLLQRSALEIVIKINPLSVHLFSNIICAWWECTPPFPLVSHHVPDIVWLWNLFWWYSKWNDGDWWRHWLDYVIGV